LTAVYAPNSYSMPAYNAALAARSLWPQRRTKDAPGEVRGVRVRVDSHLVGSRVVAGNG